MAVRKQVSASKGGDALSEGVRVAPDLPSVSYPNAYPNGAEQADNGRALPT